MLRDTLIKLQNLGIRKHLHTTDSSADSVVYTNSPLQYQSGTTSLGSSSSIRRGTTGLRRHIVQTDINPVSAKFGQYIFMSCSEGGLYRINTVTNQKEHIFIGEDVCSRNGQVFDIIEYIKNKAVQTEDTFTPNFLFSYLPSMFIGQEALDSRAINEETINYIQEHCRVLQPRKIWKLDASNLENIVNNPTSINDSIGLLTATEQFEYWDKDAFGYHFDTEPTIQNFINRTNMFFTIQESWTGSEENSANNLVLVANCIGYGSHTEYQMSSFFRYDYNRYYGDYGYLTPFLTSDGWDSFQFKLNGLDNMSTDDSNYNTITPEDIGPEVVTDFFARSIAEEDIWPSYFGKIIPPIADILIDMQGWETNAKSISRDGVLDVNQYVASNNYTNIANKITASFSQYGTEQASPIREANININKEYSLDPATSHVIYAKTELPRTDNTKPVSPCDPVIKIEYNQTVPLLTPNGMNNIPVFPDLSYELTEFKIKKHTRIGKILDIAICYNKLMVLTESSLWCSEDGFDFYKIHDNKGFNFYNEQALDTELSKNHNNVGTSMSRGFAKLIGDDTNGWYIAHDYYQDLFPSSDVRVNYNGLYVGINK